MLSNRASQKSSSSASSPQAFKSLAIFSNFSFIVFLFTRGRKGALVFALAFLKYLLELSSQRCLPFFHYRFFLKESHNFFYHFRRVGILLQLGQDFLGARRIVKRGVGHVECLDASICCGQSFYPPGRYTRLWKHQGQRSRLPRKSTSCVQIG